MSRPRRGVKDAKWSKTKIDDFVLAKLEANHLAPSPEADARTLVRRAYVDLLGYKPNYEEVEAFVQRPVAAGVRTPDRPPARVAALRRAVGPALAGRGALRRRQSHLGGHQSAVSVCLALSRLDDRSHQQRRAVRPVREAAAGGRSDARHAARRPARAGIPGRRADLSQGPAALGRRDRRLHDRRLG